MLSKKTLSLAFFSFLSFGSEASSLIKFSLDNDVFIQRDDGYTNGLYFSLLREDDLVEVGLLNKPMLWSVSDYLKDNLVASEFTFGQYLGTPKDISLSDPGPNTIPYSAMVAASSVSIFESEDYYDSIATSVGVVGPISQGERAQKEVHSILGSEEPMGWDHQLHNEPVFQFGRARMWPLMYSDDDSWDALALAHIELGTIRSSVGAEFVLRYGKNLSATRPLTLLGSGKYFDGASDDGLSGGFGAFFSLQRGYIFNQIFTDGNTFRDSPSVNYKHSYTAANIGIGYSWKNSSVAFSVRNIDVLSVDRDAVMLDGYGTLNYSYRY